jgi:predicted nucleotidyltransferase
MTDFPALLRNLTTHGVKFIVIGGAAALAHGSVRLTQDLDIVYDRSRENLERLVAALGPEAPYLRGAPPGLPFRLDVDTLLRGLNFTLQTQIGWIDLLGEVAGGGTYANLHPDSSVLDIFGYPCPCVNLPTLIRLKKAAGRPKDLEVIAELEALAEESQLPPDTPL